MKQETPSKDVPPDYREVLARAAWEQALTAAIKIFGGRLDTRLNQDAVAQAIIDIGKVLDEGGDLEITVVKRK